MQEPPRPIVFRRSARLFVMRLGMLLLATFGVLALLMYPDWLAAGLITSLGAGVAVVWYLLTRRGGTITVDEQTITRVDGDDTVRIRWVDVSSVTIGETLIPHRSDAVPARFALVRGLGAHRIAFADLTFVDNHAVFVGAPEPTPVVDIANADVLLAVVADRVEESGIIEKLEDADELELAETDEGGDDTTGPETDASTKERRSLRPGAGLLALAAKLGAKVVKPILGLFKGAQGVLALASVGVLAVIFSWKGALTLVFLLIVHELGHVFAMRRSGLPVRGIYLLPFGAATVSDSLWKTRSQQAAIALGGPLFGAIQTLALAVIAAATHGRYLIVGVAAGLGALLNLLNLLPINPLDGGRLLSAVGHSINSRTGLLLSLGGLVLGLALAIVMGYHLFTLLIVVGLIELAVERSTVVRIRQLGFVRALERYTAERLAKLRLLTRPAFPEPTESKLRELELVKLRQVETLAGIEPMRPRQVAGWFLLYGALAAGLLGLLFWVQSLYPDMQLLLEVLR